VKSVKRGSEWWVTEVPESEDCGPYETKPEAEEDREGLERTERWGHLPNYWTCDVKTKRKKTVAKEPETKPVKTAKRKTAKRKTAKRKKMTK